MRQSPMDIQAISALAPAPTGADRAVRSFMRECLMPILADEFFRRRDAELKTETKVIQQKRTTEPLCMEVEP